MAKRIDDHSTAEDLAVEVEARGVVPVMEDVDGVSRVWGFARREDISAPPGDGPVDSEVLLFASFVGVHADVYKPGLPEWVSDRGQVYEFGRVLAAAGVLASAEAALEYCADPIAWVVAHRVWEQLGSPLPPADGGGDRSGWDTFVKDCVPVLSQVHGESKSTESGWTEVTPDEGA